MKDALQNYLGRPKQYNNIDGTGETSMGLMLLGFALSGYLNTILPNTHWWNTIGGVLVMFAALIPALGLGYWGSKSIKQHITWPRTGYVAFRRSRKASWKIFALSGVAGAGFVCLFALALRHNAMKFAEVAYLAMLLAAYAFFVYRFSREHPWKWLVAAAMALGLFTMALIVPSNLMESWWFPMLFIGLVWLASGGTTLFLYMRHTQPPAPEAE
jgi:uncharacterized membrane protein